MYISSIKLTNIRSYNNLELNLSKSINLLVGNNNSGKSTIIKSIFQLQNTSAIGIEDIRKSVSAGRIYLDLEDISQTDVSAFLLAKKDEIIHFPSTNRVKVQFGMYNSLIEKQRNTEAHFFDLNLPHSFDESGRLQIDKSIKIEDELRDFHSLPNLESHQNFIFPFFSKRKTNNYASQQGPSESDIVNEDFRNITAKVQKLSNPSHPKYKRFVKYINDILGFSIGVIPDRSNNYNNTGIYVSDNTYIPISSMGEGVVNILGLIVMLLTENGKLYLIEELENDIHPRALKKLLELIIEKSSDNQFVISTHSNIVLKYLGIQGSKIFHLRWKPYEKTEEDRLPTTSIKLLGDDPKEKLELLEELGYDLFDFDLHKSYLIFEESSAETLFKKFLIPTFFPRLEGKIKTVAATGAHDLKARFHDFLRLFVFIHTTPAYTARAWVVADGDDAGKTNIESLRRSFASWDPSHFISLPKFNIEEFFPERFQQEFAEILQISDKGKKRDAKIKFNKKVMDWTNVDRETAKTEFANSSTELIGLLQKIQDKLLL
ncbi:AAA family ATPase [Pedobacter sp. HDW13]|uniref:ATP-dependent nuclease n=1 Tax=Pedobacter sp. HDW13 TaxID=2714940 RepID=UPI0014097873|nr:ATP-binding protein [Pedobacter sp. HDW13]QIL42392.1 AAA family ATPase [Pedobacter sp. HDW13]